MRGCTNRLDWKFLCQRLLTANRQCTSTSLTSQPPGRNIIIRSLSKLVPNYLYSQFYLLYKSNTRQIVRWLHGSEASLRLRRVCAECVKYFNQDPDLYCIVKVIGYLTTILIAIYTTISNIKELWSPRPSAKVTDMPFSPQYYFTQPMHGNLDRRLRSVLNYVGVAIHVDRTTMPMQLLLCAYNRVYIYKLCKLVAISRLIHYNQGPTLIHQRCYPS